MPSSSRRIAQKQGEYEEDEDVKDARVDVRSLSPKPCYTCGREISPRAKWSRNWDSIKFCSSHCKGWKSVVRVDNSHSTDDKEEGKKEKTVSFGSTILKSCLEEQQGGNLLLFHLDAWIESIMFHLVNDAKDTKEIIALQRVSDYMEFELTCTKPIPNYCIAIKDGILSQNPGQREMIRRAARRLVILPRKDWPYSRLFGETNDQINLSSDRGKKALLTLQDVSFAKGEMYIRRA